VLVLVLVIVLEGVVVVVALVVVLERKTWQLSKIEGSRKRTITSTNTIE
jgi:hypothetical protein